MTNNYSQEEKSNLLKCCVYILSDIYLSDGIDFSVNRQELNHMFYLSEYISNIFSLKFHKSNYGFISDDLNIFLDNRKFCFEIRYPYAEDSDEFWFALNLSYRTIMKRPDITKHINTLEKVIEGFCSPFGLKLLASTLHFARIEPEINEATIEKLENLINKNFPQKSKFTQYHISKALLNLEPILFIDSKNDVLNAPKSSLLGDINISIPMPSGAKPLNG